MNNRELDFTGEVRQAAVVITAAGLTGLITGWGISAETSLLVWMLGFGGICYCFCFFRFALLWTLDYFGRRRRQQISALEQLRIEHIQTLTVRDLEMSDEVFLDLHRNFLGQKAAAADARCDDREARLLNHQLFKSLKHLYPEDEIMDVPLTCLLLKLGADNKMPELAEQFGEHYPRIRMFCYATDIFTMLHDVRTEAQDHAYSKHIFGRRRSAESEARENEQVEAESIDLDEYDHPQIRSFGNTGAPNIRVIPRPNDPLDDVWSDVLFDEAAGRGEKD